MAVSKDLRGGSVKKALHKAEKANKNPNAKKAVNAKKTTSLKATAVKPARFNRGVAGVAVASTLAMMLPSAAASALQINQQNIVDSANVVSKAGKGNLRSQELNMLRWGVGARRESRQTKAFVEIARRAIEAQKQRENVENVQNTQPAISSEDFNGDKSATPTKTSEIKNTTSDSKANVTSSENTASATESANPPAGAQSSETAKVKQSEVKPVDTPAVNQPVQPTTKPESAPTAKQDEKNTAEVKQPEVNAGEVKPAENKQPVASQPANAENAKPASEQNTNAQPSSTHAENTNTVSAANAPKVRKPRSAESGDGASNGSSVTTTTTSAPATSTAPSANNTAATPNAAPVTPAANTVTPSTPVTSTSTASNAGAGTAASSSADTTAQGNTQGQGSQGSVQGSAQGSQTNAQGSQSSAEGATTGATGKDKSATPSAPVSTPSPASTSTPNAGTPNTGTPTAGTATNNTATDPNSQVIKPNTDNPTADSTDKANAQVQTDKKPKATYNLKIRYTIGGAANKQLVQPYELTIDEAKLNELNKSENYVYVKLPKSAGYNPAVYHSGNYQYYIEKSKGKYVIDDGMHADADRYLRIDKNLIKEYAVKQRQVVGGNNSDQTSQNPSSSQAPAKDGIQYYGELNINYAPKTAKYYIRHMLQDADDRNKFEEDKKVPGVKTLTVGGKQIHVTEVTGTVGSNVSAVSVYIPGYEPEHNLISSPLSDSEDEKDKLVLNLRYYRKAYDVTYDSAGGTDVTAQKVYYDQQITPGTKPTKRGYTFKGWQIVDSTSGDSAADTTSESSSTGSTSTKTVDFDKFKMPDHDVKLRAIWEKNKTTSYSVSVWVQKADLVDKDNPNSRANYDFVGLVERKNVKTGSSVDLNSMNDAGVANDSTRLSGVDENNPIDNSELGLTKEELQGTDSDHETGLIAKFNWMNDTHVTNLDGYDTENPGAESNYLRDSNGNYVTGPIDSNNRDLDNRVYKDLFTRYFYVNKKLTKRYTKDPNNTSTKLSANDLDNTFDLVYDRKEYELIFAKPAGVDGGNNAAIKRKDENGKTTIYCYAGGGDCSDKYDGVNEGDHGAEINHNGYRVKVRYGQSLTDIWPDVDELDFNNGEGSLGWRIGFAGGVKYRDTPPYRFTKKEFADPRWRAVFDKNQKDKVAPSISYDPSNPNTQKYELKDNQRLLTADTDDKSNPIQVIIRKQSIASAKKHKEGDRISEDDYELSTDSYSKDDTPSNEYDYPAPSIAGFNPADGYNTARVGEKLDSDKFEDKLEEWYNESHDHGDWYGLSDDEQKAFAKEYHLAFRKYRGVPADEQEDYTGDDVHEYDDNQPLEFRYDRQKYFVRFYNADGKAIKDGSVAAKEKLPFEYSLTKRGKKDLTGEDEKLYGKDTSYDASVVKDDLGNTSKQLDGKYTFTLNGKTYSIVRPDDLPKDYVFKGWAVDQTGRHLINGEINDNSEGAEGGSESGSKDKGEVKDYTMPVNGIKLYAAWGKPTDIKHTVTLDYDMPQIGDQGNVITNNDVTEQFTVEHRKKVNEQDLKVPTRKGYDFYGWELAKKGGVKLTDHTPYAFSNQVVEDITLKAVWIEDTRYNGIFNHIFLKPGVTIKQYKTTTDAVAKAAMVDHVSTQTVSGLREHLRYNAEAVYSDETHFPDKHFTSFEASSHEEQNTGEFIYQTYNTRKYKVKYIDQNGNELLPESEVSSVNLDYDVAFYKPIAGFKPRELQHTITYVTDDDGKQKAEDIRTFIFTYDDVRVLKRQDDAQIRPTNYTRYVFKVADGQGSMGSVVDWQGNNVADGSALVYDAIKGTKAYQMPLPTFKAKPGFEFAGWTSQIGSYGADPTKLEYASGLTRLPIRSEEQNSPEVIYTANFKLKAPVAAAPQVLTPTEQISTTSGEFAKRLITNADEYPKGATFSFVPGEKFDSTPGLHKIKVQVKLGGEKPAEAEVLYRVLPDLVYASDWDKFSKSDYGINNAKDYVPITFTGKNDEGTIIGHDTTGTTPSTGGTTTLTAYVYKGKEVRIRVPQAFGKDHSRDKYHYVFKGWTTKVVEPTVENPNPEQKFDINSSDRYADANLQNGVTYHAVYKKIDYFSNSSDGGEVPKDAVVAIFKPAAGRLWKNDGTDGPKVFYVKKGTDLSKITKTVDGKTVNVLEMLQNNLTNPTGSWSRSSMRNDGSDVKAIEPVKSWIVNEPFQEFVAGQDSLATPNVKSNTLLAIRGDGGTLPSPEKYIANYDSLIDKTKNPNVKSVTVEYASTTAPTVDKAGVYTVPLIVRVTYNDFKDPYTHKNYYDYKTVGKLKVMHDLIYGENVKDLGDKPTEDEKAEHDKIASEYKKVNFITNNSYGTMASGSRTLFYAHTNKTSGVKAPQAIGKDYDADGYHYEFVGWKQLGSFTENSNNANPLTIDKVEPNEIVQSSSIFKNAYRANTTYQAVYKRVENVIDASQQDEIPDGYVATIFLPGFGRTWADGSYKPKLLYIRHGKDKEDNIKFAKKVASDTAATLSGFTKWQMYDAKSRKSNILLHDNWDISKPRIFVAEQNGVDGVKIPETVIGVGESIPNVNKLVHNTDPKVSVSIDSSSTVDVSKPGISTIMVNVTKPIDETDSSGKQKTVTTKLPVRVYVLPKVIADNDLPAEGTAAAKFVEKNYTKVTYVAGKGGSLQKSPLDNAEDKPVSVYWVRNDATNLLMQVPDVLADNGYVFKNWTVNKIDVTDNNYATAEQREALARLAKIDGMYYVAKLISGSHKSTLAALQNLLNEAQKSRAEQKAYNVYNANREELAQVAERKGKTDLAQKIRNSHDSLQDIKNNMLTPNGIDVDKVIEQLHEKALLAKIAKEAGNEWLAKQISNSKRSSIEALKNLMQEAGIDIAEYNKLTFDKKKEALAQFADINGLHYVASIIRASHESSLEAFKSLIKSAKPDVEIPDYTANEEDYASEEQRELLIQIAEEKERPDIAAKIRLLHSSTLQDLKKLFADAGMDLYAIPYAKPKKEITITANFEQMDPVEFKFSGKAVEGVPATFTLANLTKGVLKDDGTTDTNATVSVDGKPFTVNALSSSSSLKQLGISYSCEGTTCTISGTPKIVDGKKVVELTFTSVDKYGRKAKVTVDIEVLPASNDVNPTPTPEPQPEQPVPAPVPTPEIPFVPDFAPSVIPGAQVMEPEVEQPEPEEPQPKPESKPVLAKTGSNVAQSAILASLLASVGLAGLAAKHRRKREDGKNN